MFEMQIFITGTDTNVGKTIVSSWLCLHTKSNYFKPVQTGPRDSLTVKQLSNARIYEESYIFKEPASPHAASQLENITIDIKSIKLPPSKNLIVEGAGGLMVPLNHNDLMIDLIKQFDIPVIIVARSTLGTINHTLLSLHALRTHSIKVLGVILNGPPNNSNRQAIEYYGHTDVLAQLPQLSHINHASLMGTPCKIDMFRLECNK